MKGHSGATLTRVGNLVKKEAPYGAASARLAIQAELQKSFQTNVAKLHAVPVVDVVTSEDSCAIWMPYVDGRHPLVNGGGMFAVDRCLALIQENMDASVNITCRGGGSLSRKLKRVVEGIERNEVVPKGWETAAAKCRLTFEGDIDIPSGTCHGDLTFGNMLQEGHDLYLFDFLDVVVPSPLFDMVKLRQDTSHGWAQINGLIISSDDLATLDTIICAVLSRYPAYRIYYPTFQRLNLLRILPYCNERRVAEHILRELETLP